MLSGASNPQAWHAARHLSARLFQQLLGVLVNTSQRLLQVVTRHVGEGVKLFIGTGEIGIEIGKPLLTGNNELHYQQTQPSNSLDLGRKPWVGTIVNRLSKKFEARPWCQARTIRAGHRRLIIRIAAPVDGLNGFWPEPQHHIAAGAGERGGQQSTGYFGIRGSRRIIAHEGVSHVKGAHFFYFWMLRQPMSQRIKLLLVGSCANSPPAVPVMECRATGIDGIQKIGLAIHHGCQPALLGGCCNELVVHTLHL